MGQAKARGSFAFRQSQAIERIANEHKLAEELRKQEDAKREEQLVRDAAARNTPQRLYSPNGRSAHNRATLLVAAALTMSLTGK